MWRVIILKKNIERINMEYETLLGKVIVSEKARKTISSEDIDQAFAEHTTENLRKLVDFQVGDEAYRKKMKRIKCTYRDSKNTELLVVTDFGLVAHIVLLPDEYDTHPLLNKNKDNTHA